MRPTDIETAVVWRDRTRVGTIRRSRGRPTISVCRTMEKRIGELA